MEALIKENKRLKQALKDITIEKNRLEDRMYRAFHKCLNTKKRKISNLEQELERLKDKSDAKRSKSDPNMTLDEDDITILDDSDTNNEMSQGERDEGKEDSSETDMDSDDFIDKDKDIVEDRERPPPARNIDNDKNECRNLNRSFPSSYPVRDSVRTVVIVAATDPIEGNRSEESESDEEGGLAFPFPKDFRMFTRSKKVVSSSLTTTSTSIMEDSDTGKKSENAGPKASTSGTNTNQAKVPCFIKEKEASSSNSHMLDDLIDQLSD